MDSMEASQPETSKVAGSAKPGFTLEDWGLVALVALSLVGFALADFSAVQGFRYWVYVSPAFAAVSIFVSWSRARRRDESVPEILRSQLLHWATLPVAVYLIYLLGTTGRMNAADAGLVALLSIAIITFLAGVHFEWRLAVVGAALAVGALAGAIVEQFFWIFGFVVVVLGVGVFLWRRRAPSTS